MRKRILTALTITMLLTTALAQEAPTINTLDQRLGIVERQLDKLNNEVGKLAVIESRLGRVEVDLSKLSAVPLSLARIEEKITALSEKASGNSNVLQQLAMTVVVALLTGGIGLLIGRNRGNGTK